VAKQINVRWAALRTPQPAAPANKRIRVYYAGFRTAADPKQIRVYYAALRIAGAPKQINIRYAALRLTSSPPAARYVRVGGNWIPSKRYVRIAGNWIRTV